MSQKINTFCSPPPPPNRYCCINCNNVHEFDTSLSLDIRKFIIPIYMLCFIVAPESGKTVRDKLYNTPCSLQPRTNTSVVQQTQCPSIHQHSEKSNYIQLILEKKNCLLNLSRGQVNASGCISQLRGSLFVALIKTFLYLSCMLSVTVVTALRYTPFQLPR